MKDPNQTDSDTATTATEELALLNLPPQILE
jgi:hypothetical protein